MPKYTLREGVLAVIQSGVHLERDPKTGKAPVVELPPGTANDLKDLLEPVPDAGKTAKPPSKPLKEAA